MGFWLEWSLLQAERFLNEDEQKDEQNSQFNAYFVCLKSHTD
ncbi:MAG: hypothetical protein RLZZ517_411 [Candidatus Parcubacteria bacterium]|jgi:hypothetical protein